MEQAQRMKFYGYLDEVTSEIVKLREQRFEIDNYALRPHFQQLIHKFREQCESLSIDLQQIDLMVYGLVAAIDEAALSCTGELAMFWMVSTLQFEYYGENMAGEKFYNKLDDIMKEPDRFSEPLYLYYRMLGIGFEGRYFGNNAEREKIIEASARALVRIHSEHIPPVQEYAEDKGGEGNTFYIPGWVYAVAVVVLMVAGWFINSVSSKAYTKEILSKVEQSSTPASSQKAGK